MKPRYQSVACIGAAAMDRRVHPEAKLLWGTSNPVSSRSAPGGVARNIAEGLAWLDCRVALFSVVGCDRDGDALLEGLDAVGVERSGVIRSQRLPTASYTAVLDRDGQLLVGLADMAILDQLDASWADQALEALLRHDLWIVDTNLMAATLERLLRGKNGRTVLADPVSAPKAARLRGMLGAVDAVFPDRAELAELCGRTVESASEVALGAAALRQLGAGAVLVTLGREGIYVDDEGRHEFLPALRPEAVRDITGAGDALVAGYAYGLITGEADPALLGLAAAGLALESELAVPADLTRERLLRRARDGR